MVTTEGDGEIVDHEAKDRYENQELTFFRLKPEFRDDPRYTEFTPDRIFQTLYDWMTPWEFETVTLKRREVTQFLGGWYLL